MKSMTLFFLLLALLPRAWAAVPTATPGSEGPAYVAPQAPIHVVTDAELEVYAAFVSQAWPKTADNGPLARQTVLLENDFLDVWQPMRRAWETYLLKKVRGQGRADEAAHEAFLKRPQQVIRFYSFPALETPVRLLRSDVLRKSMEKKGWNGFYDAYPKTQGVLSLSGIGFGASGQEAVFSARLQCGKRCGYRDVVFMRKVNGVWTLIMKDALP